MYKRILQSGQSREQCDQLALACLTTLLVGRDPCRLRFDLVELNDACKTVNSGASLSSICILSSEEASALKATRYSRKIYCTCLMPWPTKTLAMRLNLSDDVYGYVRCDSCGRSFHFGCVNLTAQKASQVKLKSVFTVA